MSEVKPRREYGTGSVIHRGNQVGIAVSLGKHEDGRRNRPVFFAATEREARAKAKAAKAAHKAGRTAPKRNADHTMQNLFDELLTVIKMTRRENTYLGYSQNWRTHIQPAIGKRSLSTLTQPDLQAILTRMVRSGLKPGTVAQCRKVLNVAMSYAVRWRWIEDNPAVGLECPRIERREAVEYSLDMALRIRQAMQGHYLQHLIDFCIATGVRPSEALAIRESDLIRDPNTKVIVAVRITYQLHKRATSPRHKSFVLVPLKTDRSYRTIPVDRLGREAIEVSLKREYKSHCDTRKEDIDFATQNSLVFRSRVGTPVTADCMRRRYQAILTQNGLPPTTRHQLRHLNASLLVDAGESPATVAALLGDTVETVMGTYVHAFEASKKTAASRLSDRLLQQDTPTQNSGDKSRPRRRRSYLMVVR